LLRTPDVRFKFAVVDCFFVQRAIPPTALGQFAGIVLKEHASVKLRFIRAAADSGFGELLAKEILRRVGDLCVERAWRTRHEAIGLFGDIARFTEGAPLAALALRALDDDVFTVRKAAAVFLGRVFATGAEVPAPVAALATDPGFRKRQAAVWILVEMHNGGTSGDLRERAATALATLTADPVAIVSAAASEGVASVSGT
jgi:HEAT repeat protein